MTRQCVLKSCSNKSGSTTALFKFPKDINRRKAWFEAVAPELPEDSTPQDLNNKFICEAHFSPTNYAAYCNKKRLFYNACPITIEPSVPRETDAVLIETNRRSKACQVHMAHNEREIINLKKKIFSLEKKMEKLKLDPPASLILKNRHKLAQYVSNEAWILFDCAVQNQQRLNVGNRHTSEVKRLCASLANTCRNNRIVYKTLRSIFALPSYRTLGRFEREVGMKLINGADALHIPTDLNKLNLQIEPANPRTINMEEINLENINIDNNFVAETIIEELPSPIIFD